MSTNPRDDTCTSFLNYMLREGITDLSTLQSNFSLQRSATLLHLQHLEQDGFLERTSVPTSSGKTTHYKPRKYPIKKIILQPTYDIKEIVREFYVLKSNVIHLSTREMENQSDTPQEYYVMYIEGDINKKWEDIHPEIFEIRDNKEIPLEYKLLKDQPQYKRFRVKFPKPLYPKESIKIMFKYEWDEPNKSRPFDTAYYKPNQLVFRIHFKDKKEHQARLYEIDPLTNQSNLSYVRPSYDKHNNTITWNCEEAIKSRHYKVIWDEAIELV